MAEPVVASFNGTALLWTISCFPLPCRLVSLWDLPVGTKPPTTKHGSPSPHLLCSIYPSTTGQHSVSIYLSFSMQNCFSCNNSKWLLTYSYPKTLSLVIGDVLLKIYRRSCLIWRFSQLWHGFISLKTFCPGHQYISLCLLEFCIWQPQKR